jgi:hypothetical protein
VSGHTTFDPSDAPRSHRGRFNWLAKLNQGVGEQDRDLQRQRAGVERDLGVVAARLDLTEHQRARSQWLLDRIDMKDEVLPSGPIEVAILAVVSLAVDEDRTRAAQYDSGKKQSVLRDTAFAQLLEEFDVSRRQVRQTRHRVRETDTYESPN